MHAELIAIAKEGWAYGNFILSFDLSLLTAIAHMPIKGTMTTNIRAFHPYQEDKREKGVGRPDLLKSFVEPRK